MSVCDMPWVFRRSRTSLLQKWMDQTSHQPPRLEPIQGPSEDNSGGTSG
jgi:hypothetical protein